MFKTWLMKINLLVDVGRRSSGIFVGGNVEFLKIKASLQGGDGWDLSSTPLVFPCLHPLLATTTSRCSSVDVSPGWGGKISLTFLGYVWAALFALFSICLLAKFGRGGGVGGTLQSWDFSLSLISPLTDHRRYFFTWHWLRSGECLFSSCSLYWYNTHPIVCKYIRE